MDTRALTTTGDNGIRSFTVHNPFGLSISSLFNCYATVTLPEIKKVIFQKEHTIVIWADGERTVIRCCEEEFDKEKGLAMAIAKRFMDRNTFKRLIENAYIQDK